MLQFFYQTRNILGLILVMGPLLGILTLDWPVSFFAGVLFSAAASVPLLCAALRRLPFRIWLLLCELSVLAAMMLLLPALSDTSDQNISSRLFPSALLLGAGSSGLLLILPPNMTLGWFRRSKTLILGLVWSGSFALMPPFRLLFQTWPVGTLLLSFLLMTAGCFFFLERPPVDYGRRDNPLTLDRKSFFTKPAFYVMTLSASAGMAFSLLLLVGSQSVETDTFLNLTARMLTGILLLASPLLFWYFMEKKGIFSSCILLIFLCEGTVLCLGTFTGSLFLLLGCCMLSAAAGGLTVVLPILTFYLFGHVNYLESWGRLILFLPAGLLCSLPFCHLASQGSLSRDEPVVFLLVLLVISFFCIFFAWKHRFVILKNKVL